MQRIFAVILASVFALVFTLGFVAIADPVHRDCAIYEQGQVKVGFSYLAKNAHRNDVEYSVCDDLVVVYPAGSEVTSVTYSPMHRCRFMVRLADGDQRTYVCNLTDFKSNEGQTINITMKDGILAEDSVRFMSEAAYQKMRSATAPSTQSSRP